MIWGCFMGNKLKSIAFIDGSIKKEQYIAILDQYLLEFIDALRVDDLWDITFQQDNARPHTANLSRDWLKNAAREHGFIILKWSSNSSNMNPIKNLWAYLKLELHRRYPDIKYLSRSLIMIKEILKYHLFEVWEMIEEKILNKLMKNMSWYVYILLEVKS